jgi:galactonate dehydratase
LWFEEPVPPENTSALARVARATRIPITTGERLTSKYDFARLLEHAAASIQLSLSSQNFLIMEGIERFDGIYDEITDPPFTWREGFIIPSERPGLGHSLREDVARSLRPDGPGPSRIRAY